ncbi:unnamed protein product [Calypogeia fissa]
MSRGQHWAVSSNDQWAALGSEQRWALGTEQMWAAMAAVGSDGQEDLFVWEAAGAFAAGLLPCVGCSIRFWRFGGGCDMDGFLVLWFGSGSGGAFREVRIGSIMGVCREEGVGWSGGVRLERGVVSGDWVE